jgi:hypothetical protein
MGRPGAGVIIIFTFLPGKCADPLQFEMNSKEPERAGLMENWKLLYSGESVVVVLRRHRHRRRHWRDDEERSRK